MTTATKDRDDVARAALAQADAEHAELQADETPTEKVDDAPADAAPRRAARAPRKRPPRERAPRRSRTTKPPLQPQLETLLASVGLVVSMAPYKGAAGDGTLVMENASNVARAWSNAAKQNPQIERVLRGLVETSVWGELVFAHMPLVLGVLANHGKVPAQLGAVASAMAPAPNIDLTQNDANAQPAAAAATSRVA